MAPRRALNAQNLERLGAAALAELLIEVSAGHAAMQRVQVVRRLQERSLA